MKAVLYDKFGAAERLQWRDTLDPALGEGKVLVKVAAAALNPKDVLVRKGKFKAFTGTRMPRIPGYDLCGEVVALGLGAVGTATVVPAAAELNTSLFGLGLIVWFTWLGVVLRRA